MQIATCEDNMRGYLGSKMGQIRLLKGHSGPPEYPKINIFTLCPKYEISIVIYIHCFYILD